MKKLLMIPLVVLIAMNVMGKTLGGWKSGSLSPKATSGVIGDSLDSLRDVGGVETTNDDSIPYPLHFQIIAPIKSSETGDTLNWELDTTDAYVFGSGYLVTSAEVESTLVSIRTVVDTADYFGQVRAGDTATVLRGEMPDTLTANAVREIAGRFALALGLGSRDTFFITYGASSADTTFFLETGDSTLIWSNTPNPMRFGPSGAIQIATDGKAIFGVSAFHINTDSDSTLATYRYVQEIAGDTAGLFVRKDGSVELTANWDAGPYRITSAVLESDTSATAPIIVASNALCTNLNADLLDSKSEAEFADLSEDEDISGKWEHTDTLEMSGGKPMAFINGSDTFWIYMDANDTAQIEVSQTKVIQMLTGAGKEGIINYPNQSSIRAYVNSLDSMIQNDTLVVEFDAESWDAQGEWDPSSNHRFTAEATGYYHVSATIDHDNNSAASRLGIYVDGSPYAWGPVTGMRGECMVESDVYCAASSYIDIRITSAGGSAAIETGSEKSYVSIHKFR